MNFLQQSIPLKIVGGIAAHDGAVICRRCGHSGCDVKIAGCGCSMHAVSTKNSTVSFCYNESVLIT